MASLATLKDIEQQRNPKRLVEVQVSKSTLKIGKDSLDLSIKSSHDGYLYLILLGSDSKAFMSCIQMAWTKIIKSRLGKPFEFLVPIGRSKQRVLLAPTIY